MAAQAAVDSASDAETWPNKRVAYATSTHSSPDVWRADSDHAEATPSFREPPSEWTLTARIWDRAGAPAEGPGSLLLS